MALTEEEKKRIEEEEAYRAEVRRKEEKEAKEKKARSDATGCLVAVAMIIVTFLLLVGSCETSKEDPALKAQREKERLARECTDKTSAFIMSQQFVKEQLKSPSTAKFPWSTESEGVRVFLRNPAECKHEVHAYVDSQNSFGATVRTKYVAELQNVKGTERWKLLSLKTD